MNQLRDVLFAMSAILIVQGCAADADPDLVGEIRQDLNVGTTPVSESVEIVGQGDHYLHHINVLNGGSCSFQTTLGTLHDSVMSLRDASNTILGFNDDSGGTLASRLELTLSPGVYTVDIGAFGDFYTGTYTLTAQCGSNVLGRFARWCGKVNIHQSGASSWQTDADCTSGCNIGGLAYCQKFFPGSTSVRQVSVSGKPNNVWNTAGCGVFVDDFDGSDEFECVAQ